MKKFAMTRRGRMPSLAAVFASIAVFAVMFFGCASKAKTSSAHIKSGAETLTDERDGKKYRTAVIGDRRWMAENLNYRPQSGNSRCYGDSDSHCKKYGRLYDWNTAAAVCPSGWHLSSREDWRELLIVAGGGLGAGKALKAKTGWSKNDDDEADGNGTDDYRFSALPGGARNPEDGDFDGIGEYGYWWTAAEYGNDEAFARGMGRDDDVFGDDNNHAGDDDLNAVEKGTGLSVRCVQDGSASAEEQREAERLRVGKAAVYFTDSRTGRKYRAVEIGEQTWMAENLEYQPKNGNSWCYGNDKSNCAAYGRLYDWNTATKACPAGWHLPAEREWDSLARWAGSERDMNERGDDYREDAGKRLKARNGWNVWRSASGNGADKYGFSAMPGGHRAATRSDIFNNIGYYGYWWTATERSIDNAAARTMNYDDGDMSEDDGDIRYGFSVRCVQNAQK
ncbi:MAG: hypothetical protein LBB74_06670 [Chitinispirillales bacterium]|jgi:uncharacterized protein (TIGR02145 family)|nr:hypothetical protein [Chitinispirillales bacterium]